MAKVHYVVYESTTPSAPHLVVSFQGDDAHVIHTEPYDTPIEVVEIHASQAVHSLAHRLGVPVDHLS